MPSCPARPVRTSAHPLRLRVLRLCAPQQLTNKQLADRLGRDPATIPATIHHHVRMLVDAGFLDLAPVRTGPSGALEKAYRASRSTWWLDDPLARAGEDASTTMPEAVQDELREAGPNSVKAIDRFMLHLSPEEVAQLERRILAILDEYIETDDERRNHPAHGGILLIHEMSV